MSARLRLYDCRNSRLPELVGLCTANTGGLAGFVNAAQRRLLYCKEVGDEGWWGTWAEVSFPGLSRTTPFITLPREIARVEKIMVCRRAVPVQNQFYEYLDFGNGRMPHTCRGDFGLMQAVARNNAVTFRDLSSPPQIIRIYPTDTADVGASRRVLVQGTDNVDNVVYTQDGLNRVTGEFVTVAAPFSDTIFQYNSLTGFQKDVTSGPLQIFQVNPTTGEEIMLLTMSPSERVAGYRRYYLHNLPLTCCDRTPMGSTFSVTAIVKLDLIPVVIDTDYLLLHNLEAITEECIAVRMSEMDNLDAQKLAAVHHINAVRLLNSEIAHYLGKQSPAVNFSPFGSAHLSCQKIGVQI